MLSAGSKSSSCADGRASDQSEKEKCQLQHGYLQYGINKNLLCSNRQQPLNGLSTLLYTGSFGQVKVEIYSVSAARRYFTP